MSLKGLNDILMYFKRHIYTPIISCCAGGQHDSEKISHPQYNPCYPERNMVLPSPTLRCYTPPFAERQIIAHASTFNSKTVPRVTNQCSAAHVAQKGSPWRRLKRRTYKPLTWEGGGRVACQAAWNMAQEEREPSPPRALVWQIGAVEVGQGRGREGAWEGGVLCETLIVRASLANFKLPFGSWYLTRTNHLHLTILGS